MFPEVLEFHVAKYVNDFIDWLVTNGSVVFETISSIILSLLLAVNNLLNATPWWIIIGIVVFGAWLATRKIGLPIVLGALLILIGVFGLWALAMETLALVITAVVFSIAIGIPLGVLMAQFDRFATILKPFLDAMQTMPSFVHLIPAMMLFGLGKVPAVLATMIYAIPPVIRLTNLGIRQVPKQVQEAAKAYGATNKQLLREVRLPLALPTILAGVNQTTMMALAMVVIASMIGARGLGQEVLLAINRVDVGRGFEAGISIVILAIVIDRITQGIAKRWQPPKS
ncbi:MAG: proline/glycine betaine ABC transporter permease [Kosmotoga sp.]|nr:MAG: proline/glycine betaine ABC transporter permease [Kosmotoga sp.]